MTLYLTPEVWIFYISIILQLYHHTKGAFDWPDPRIRIYSDYSLFTKTLQALIPCESRLLGYSSQGKQTVECSDVMYSPTISRTTFWEQCQVFQPRLLTCDWQLFTPLTEKLEFVFHKRRPESWNLFGPGGTRKTNINISDQDLNSSYNFNTLTIRQAMRIKGIMN